MEPTQPIDQPEPARKRYLCRHIHTTGNRCGSPALRGEEFCYFHHTSRPRRRSDRDFIFPNSAFDLPSLEDRASIQCAILEVAHRIAFNQLDHERARLLLRALRIASINLPREPRSKTEPAEITQVEEIELDPLHGPLAPIAEVPVEETRKGFAQLLLEQLRSRQAAEPDTTEDPQAPEEAQPSLDLHAVADQPQHRVPHVRRIAPTMGLLHTPTADSRPLKAGSQNNPRHQTSKKPKIRECLHPAHRKNAMDGASGLLGRLIGEREYCGGSFVALRMTNKKDRQRRRRRR